MIGVVGTGQVAQHVIAFLKAEELPHVVYTRSSSHGEGGAYFYSLENIQDLLKEHGVTSVINCAALRDINLCEQQPDQAWLANVELPRKISQLVHQVYISTDYVYDANAQNRILHEEEESRGALSVYGQTKLEGENVVRRHAGVVARISSPFGIYPSPMKPHFVDFAAMKVGDLDLPTDQHFKLTYLPDATPHIASLAMDYDAMGVYHIINEGSTTWLEVGRLARQLNRNKSRTTGSMRWDKTRPSYSALANTRLPVMRHWTEAMMEYFRGPSAEERIKR